MPDQYGFNDLGSRRFCIVPGCGAGGPSHEWTEIERMAHHDAHEDQRRKTINDAAAARLRAHRKEKTT